MKPLRRVREAEAKIAFEIIAGRLHELRSSLREAVDPDFLTHPAYPVGSFPIWWEGQPSSKVFLVEKKPPAYVRFSHQPSVVDRGRSLGVTAVQPFSERRSVAVALISVVRGAFPSGEVLRRDGLEITVGQISGHDPLPSKGVFMGSVMISWTVTPGH